AAARSFLSVEDGQEDKPVKRKSGERASSLLVRPFLSIFPNRAAARSFLSVEDGQEDKPVKRKSGERTSSLLERPFLSGFHYLDINATQERRMF
ncbi:hypothetical protein AALB64_08305, partial [Lachnospiraceae bacterium 45-P1]